jgi:hypothetical protein
MAFITFSDWIAARESSAFTRLRHAAALGLAPPIPAASINSRSTASPFESEKLRKKKMSDSSGKCTKKDCKKCKKKKKLDEVSRNTKIDDFLNAVGALKDDTKKVDLDKKKADLNVKAGDQKEEPKDTSETKPDANSKPAGKNCRWVCD